MNDPRHFHNGRKLTAAERLQRDEERYHQRLNEQRALMEKWDEEMKPYFAKEVNCPEFEAFWAPYEKVLNVKWASSKSVVSYMKAVAMSAFLAGVDAALE